MYRQSRDWRGRVDRVVIGVVEKTKGERVWRDFRLRWFEREREMMNSCYI